LLVAAIALASIVLLGSRWLASSQASSEQALSLASALGEVRQVALPDGSRLILDSNTRIDVHISADERRLVLLEGRARFMVAHERRPFVVVAAASEVIARGTVFDVDLIQGRLAVLLLQGSVEVRQTAGQSTAPAHRLEAGQKLIIGRLSSPVMARAVRGETLWPSRMLEFDDVPLEDAAAMVNRYSRVQLKVRDPRIGGLRINGAYRAGDVSGFARSLAAAFGLRVQQLDDGNLLLARPDDASRRPSGSQ
jgi:transmembrane sensor